MIRQCCRCIAAQLSCSVHVRAKAGRKGRRQSLLRGRAMTFHEYLSDDAQLAAKRDRLLLVACRARMARRERVGPAVPVRRLARLLFRRAPA